MNVIKVQHPVKLPTIETLMACRNGLTKRIKKAKNVEKPRLRDIRDEIDSLIEAL